MSVERLGLGQARTSGPVGRGSELADVAGFLEAADSGGVLVLSGEPGIGKSTLWDAGVEVARSRGFSTLCARASEAEAQLSFAGLADLLEALDPAVWSELPAAQRHALEVAVRRTESAELRSDPLAVSAGLLGVLRLLSARGRVLVAVDDVPWLDRASAAALAFAARRLAGEGVRYLVTRRRVGSSELERVLDPEGIFRREVEPLSLGAISRLLSDRVGQSLPRRALREVYETSGGNPLFAVELGRALIEGGLPEIGAGLPVPERLEELFGARVAALTQDVRRALLAVALSGGLSREELAGVVDPLAIEDAQASGVLSLEGTHVRASHPLLAAAASRQSSAAQRRELHLALGEAVHDPPLRARHRAMAAVAPDSELAREVSVAAVRAAALGAAGDAAELGTYAVRLTPADDREYDARVLALARYLFTAGEITRGSELLSERIGALAPGPPRAAAHLLLAEDEPSLGEEHLALAIAESTADPGLHAQALALRVEKLAVNDVERITEAEEIAREAVASARAAGADEERRPLVALAWARILRGCAIDDLLARSRELPPTSLSLYESSVERPSAVRLVCRGELTAAREAFRKLLAGADERGESRSGTVFTLQLCEVELRAGDALEAAQVLDESGQWIADPDAGMSGIRVRAMLAAVRGEPARAAELAATVLDPAASGTHNWDRLEAARAGGIAALLERDPDRATSSLEAIWEHTLRAGAEEPGAFPVAGDLVEALVEVGRPDAAGAVIERLARLACEQQHPWGLATVKRSSAMVTLAAGYDDAAAAQLAKASADYSALGLGFESARVLLYLGRVQRRAKKRAAARESLEAARSAFEQLGCSGWAEAASAELDRISGRRRAASGGLTPSEQRVAELVASGLSNKEIAVRLFVSVSTVEAHLSNAYAKLEIRSRTQLARRLGASA